MRIDIVTIFPELFEPFVRTALLGKAVDRGLVEIVVHDLRDHTHDRHRTVDDEAYGGGPGMVMRCEPLFEAVEAIGGDRKHVVLLSPQGAQLNQARAVELSGHEHIVLICGRYEGIDERVTEHLVDEELSIGDYVLNGGEVAAMVVIEAISRLIPGMVGTQESIERDSFTDGLLDHPHYTRPAEFRGWKVPDVLLSGNHAAVDRWRRDRALERTKARRPDLLASDPIAHESPSDA